MPSKPYVVRTGEYLTAIAFRFGTTVDKILADPANAAFKQSRPHPEILAAGDVVYIPEQKPTWFSVGVGATNSFVGTPLQVTVRVVLLGPDRKPLANKSVTTTPDLGKPLSTDGDGLLVCSVNASTPVIDVAVDGTDYSFHVRVGNLDPIDTDSGMASRLRHLGHLGDEAGHVQSRPWLSNISGNLAAHSLAASVASFQRTNGQDDDGVADSDVQSAVRDAHGC